MQFLADNNDASFSPNGILRVKIDGRDTLALSLETLENIQA
jgi:hypothetical protein